MSRCRNEGACIAPMLTDLTPNKKSGNLKATESKTSFFRNCNAKWEKLLD